MEEEQERLQPLLPPLSSHCSRPTAGLGLGCRSYLRMAAWLCALFAAYTVQRGASQLGLPYDGLQKVDFLEFFQDASCLSLYGAVLGWFADVPRRRWLFCRQQSYVWVTILVVPPIYSAISNIQPLKHDLAHLSGWGALFSVVWAVGMLAIVAVVCWHLVMVARQRSRADATAYAASRLLLFAFFGGSAVALRSQGIDMHLHHLYLGWALALWGELDHPLSAATLAVGAGIFVQGTAAYSFAPIFQRGCITSPSSKFLSCEFTAESPFSVQFCWATGGAPTHTCHT